MDIKFLKRGFINRLLGIPATAKPANDACWTYKDGRVIIDLEKAVELKSPGGALRMEGKTLPKRVLVVWGEDGEYRAFHNRCTHLVHRRLDPVPGTNTVQCCSMNKSTYDVDGKTLFGPAPHPIMRFPVDIKENELIVRIQE